MFIINIIRKIVFKIFALLLLVVLSLFNMILGPIGVIFNIAAIPVSLIAVIGAFIMGFMNGFGAYFFIVLTGSGLLVGLKYLLPYCSDSLDLIKFALKEYLYEPLIIRSPVKYTI